MAGAQWPPSSRGRNHRPVWAPRLGGGNCCVQTALSALHCGLFGKSGFALAEMTANALKPKSVFGIVRIFRQSSEVWPDFKVTLIDSLQMLSRGFHLFLHHSFEVSRPHGGNLGGNPGLQLRFPNFQCLQCLFQVHVSRTMGWLQILQPLSFHNYDCISPSSFCPEIVPDW